MGFDEGDRTDRSRVGEVQDLTAENSATRAGRVANGKVGPRRKATRSSGRAEMGMPPAIVEPQSPGEALFRAVFERSADPILIADDRGRYTQANPAAGALFGLPASELVGRLLDEFAEPGFDVASAGRESLEGGGTRGRFRIVRPDGGVRSVEFSAMANVLPGHHLWVLQDVTDRDRAGQATLEAERLARSILDSLSSRIAMVDGSPRVIVAYEDVIRRKLAEEASRRNGTLFAQMFRHSPIGMALAAVEPLGRLRMVNPAFCRMLGFAEEELIAGYCHTVTDDGFVERDLQLNRALMRGEIPSYCIEKRYLHKCGNAIWGRLHVTIIDDETGRPTHLLGMVEDITDRKRAEAERDRLFDLSLDMMSIVGLDGYFKQLNPAWRKTLGWGESEMLGRPWEEFVHPEDYHRTAGAQARLAAGEPVLEFENRYRCADGSYRWISWNAFPLPAERVVFSVARDVTEQVRAKAELTRAKEAAEEAGLMKDRFLATLSHELRTPLTPVMATVSYLEKSPDLPAEFREGFASIRRNIELEARLIDDLLDVTRIGQGKLELHREVVDTHAALRAALGICHGEADAKGLEISMALRARHFRAWADPVRIQQVFWNLIRNAVKFTPPGGRISFRSADVGAGRLAIEVADTGVGIEPEALPRIFEPFEQGDSAATRALGGLGLGLAIARMLVDLHGGTLTVTSEGPGSGSLFRIELESIPPSEGRCPPSEPAAAEGQTRLLLVEDNLDSRQAIALLLRSSGLAVRTAGSVEEALAALADERFDLLISDIGLPDGSGLEIMRHCRDRLGLKGIAYSGYGTPDDVSNSLEAGFSHHLNKPASLNTILGLIRQTTS